jgi:hypothetical protein
MAHAVRYASAHMTPFQPFDQPHARSSKTTIPARFHPGTGIRLLPLGIFSILAIALPGCGNAGSRQTGPANVVVSVQPTSANVFLGQQQPFQAVVIGTTDTTVTWQVNGATGGSTSVGTVSTGGLYTAPPAVPSPPAITVEAVSNAHPQSSASAVITLMDNITVNVTPSPVNVPTGGAQVFTATVSGAGSASTAVTWSVNGISGGNATVGAVVPNGAGTGVYTAPLTPPSPPTVSVTATSAADMAKSGSASITVTCAAANSIAPAAVSVGLSLTQSFTASFCFAAGTPITWDVNGVVGGNSVLGTIVSTGPNVALYIAPADFPSANPETVHATANPPTGGAQTAAATVTVTSSVAVSVSPGAATVSLGQRMAFAASVTNTSDAAVAWAVNGTPNGNAIVGEICQSGSNPCAPPPGPFPGSVDYVAPGSAPLTNPVVLTATSRADATRSGNSFVTIAAPVGPVTVAVSPPLALVPPSTGTLSRKQFFAEVTGTINTAVTWTVQSGVAGQGCGGAACGSVDANGLYTAPTAAPSPNAISITATSQANSTISASSTIALTSGPLIYLILPSSVMAGAVEGFPFTIQGMNFVAGSGGSGSVILFNGAPRSTTCPAATSCTIALTPADVQAAATLTVQVQNPGPQAALSNPVPFVIVPFDMSEDVISLSTGLPVATGKDVVVVEPTTAAESAAINVNFIGVLTGGNNCGVQGSPLTVTRPASGSAVVSICVNGNALDPTFTYAFTGPPGGDIAITASAVTGLFPGTMQLDLQIASTTLPGVRTLFITTLNQDRAAATGMLEVK